MARRRPRDTDPSPPTAIGDTLRCPPSDRCPDRHARVEVASPPPWLPEDEMLAGLGFLDEIRRGR